MIVHAMEPLDKKAMNSGNLPFVKPLKRSIRRTALILFPKVSCSKEYFRRIKEEGFTDIGFSVKEDQQDQSEFVGQGYSLDQAKQVAAWAEELDLGVNVFTGYMKYREKYLAEHPDRAMKLACGQGVERDSDHLEVSAWLCPFQAGNQQEHLKFLQEILTFSTLREVHLNDEAFIGFPNGAIGCYCDSCTAEFKRQFGFPPPTKPDWQSEKWWRWIKYRMEHWTQVHASFRSKIKEKRPDVLVGIQHSPLAVSFENDPTLSGINLAQDALALDLLCTDPYHHIQSYFFTHRPLRRIVTEATRILAGATIERSMNIYPQAFMPPKSSIELTRRDGLMAGIIPFALGAETITPYAYELMKIIPGFFDGFQETKKLIPYFERTRPYSYVTVLNPTQTQIYGHLNRNWGRDYLSCWPDLMNQLGLPWRWISDQRLSDLTDELGGPIIVPAAHCLTRDQTAHLEKHLHRGHGILWVGPLPKTEWSGKGLYTLPEGAIYKEAELKRFHPEHPLWEGVEEPIILKEGFIESTQDGTVLGEIEGRPGFVLREIDGGRAAWIGGMPAFNYVKSGGHGSVRTPTGGARLLYNILHWLARKEPMAKLWPYPPPNAYRDLRSWDRRDVPTMELFPMMGDQELVCILFNYVGLAYRTNLIMHFPEKAVLNTLSNIVTNESLMHRAHIDNHRVILPIEMPAETEYLAIALTWKP